MTTRTVYPAGYTSAYPTSYPSGKEGNFFERLCRSVSDDKFTASHGIKVRYLINFFKATTAFYVLSLMKKYDNYSLGSFLYLALHGIYGFIWIIKDMAFPDKSFDKKVGFFGTIMTTAMLSAYWVLPWLQVSGHGIDKPSHERVMFCVMLFTLGIMIMIASDAQKTFTLKHKQGLITDGMFKYTRNPNYLGEMMIYAAFAFATGSIFSWAILGSFWVLFFFPRMVSKDVSLRSKEGASEYFSRSSMLLPKLFFKNSLLNYAAWAAIFSTLFWITQFISFTTFLKHPSKTMHKWF